MKIYQIILASILLVSCSDYIDNNREFKKYTNSYNNNEGKEYSTNMGDIDNDVKNKYQAVKKKMNSVQIELRKKNNSLSVSLKTLKAIWDKSITEQCDSEFPINASRGSIATTENTLCLITATELHTNEILRLLDYDLNNTSVSKNQKYEDAVCSFYKSYHRKECFERIRKNKNIISNLGDVPENIDIKDYIYIVNVKRAYIYEKSKNNSATSSFFIEGDKIEPLMVIGNWVKVSYLNGSKQGWLHLNDLEKKRY